MPSLNRIERRKSNRTTTVDDRDPVERLRDKTREYRERRYAANLHRSLGHFTVSPLACPIPCIDACGIARCVSGRALGACLHRLHSHCIGY
jgi:hypothetical protein